MYKDCIVASGCHTANGIAPAEGAIDNFHPFNRAGCGRVGEEESVRGAGAGGRWRR